MFCRFPTFFGQGEFVEGRWDLHGICFSGAEYVNRLRTANGPELIEKISWVLTGRALFSHTRRFYFCTMEATKRPLDVAEDERPNVEADDESKRPRVEARMRRKKVKVQVC